MIVNIHILYRFVNGDFISREWYSCNEVQAETIIKSAHDYLKSSQTLAGYTLSVERMR